MTKVQTPQAPSENALEGHTDRPAGCSAGCCPSPKEHYRSLSYVSHGAGSYHTKDRQLAKDRDAYKRLRNNGLQPSKVDGSYELEAKAKTEAQVEGRPDARL